jgi:hypothetical protein
VLARQHQRRVDANNMAISAVIAAPLWIAGSVVMVSLQAVLIGWTAVAILGELAVLRVCLALRGVLRWATWPLPSRWRRKKQFFEALARLRHAKTYDQWLAAATELDELDGAAEWRATKGSDEYDWALVEGTTKRLRRARKTGDVYALAFALSSGLIDRHFAGIDNSSLYVRARTGTKRLIEAYITEVQKSLVAVADSAALPPDAKLEFFETARLALGRTVLALSGGGALALAHGGVVRTLISRGESWRGGSTSTGPPVQERWESCPPPLLLRGRRRPASPRRLRDLGRLHRRRTHGDQDGRGAAGRRELWLWRRRRLPL